MSFFHKGLPESPAELSAAEVHDNLMAAVRDFQRAEKNVVLWFGEIHARKLHRELGFSSIFQYAAEALDFSRSRTCDQSQGTQFTNVLT